MALTTTRTYAIRLSVEEGGKVVAQLQNIGTAGEQSFKQLQNAGGKTSSVLSALTDRTDLLKGVAFKLGGVLLGLATVGGFAAFTKSAIDASSTLVDTADKLGINTQALQELRFAASLASVDQEKFDKGLQVFVRRLGDAKAGTGEAKDELNRLGISLRDTTGNVRATESILNDVADALQNIHDPADKVRVAFNLFGKEGVGFINVLAGGSAELEKTKQRARELGIVLEDDLLRDAEAAGDQLDTLSQVIKVNFSRAVLDLAPVIGDAAKALADFAAEAGVAYEKTKLFFSGDFDFKGLSQHSTERLYKDYKSQVDEVQSRLKEIGDPPNPFKDLWGWNEWMTLKTRLDDIMPQYEEYSKRYQKAQADVASAGKNAKAATEDQLAAAVAAEEERKEKLTGIEEKLQGELFNINYQGSARIEAERKRAIDEINKYAAPNGGNADQINKMLEQTNQLYNSKLKDLRNKDVEQAGKVSDANEKIVQSLIDEQNALHLSERDRFIEQTSRRLSAEATKEQRKQVSLYAGQLYDEKQALEKAKEAEQKRQETLDRVKEAMESHIDVMKKYGDELAELNQLLSDGAISQDEYAAAVDKAQDEMLESSRDWSAGMVRGLKKYADEAGNRAAQVENVVTDAFGGIEDALVKMAMTGKFEWKDMVNSMIEDIVRLVIKSQITGPLAGALGSAIGGMFGYANGGVFEGGIPLTKFATGGVVSSPTMFPMQGGAGLMGEAGPEAIMPLRRLPSGRLGVESNSGSNPVYYMNVDARGSTDPQATQAQVEAAVDQALSARIPNIVKASASVARSQVVDSWQRRGGRFD